MTDQATTRDLRRDDLVVERSATGSSYGIVVQIGGSTSRYRHDSRNLRAASKDEVVKALAFKLAQEVRAELHPEILSWPRAGKVVKK